ncbi:MULTISPECIES: CDP-glycerol glycerophosphotransferase family protein [Gammaproteobacteria]|uniref:CDP-glycerol glycerophosphotransferase family protein n=1 Tax=Gammaproteobacteria TaxID=1236 RepID=UPI000DD05F37|nr:MULTISPECIES: CDP-glycerol glycerophosphotransferase family protein [Gammaproteobacteria]RTE86838.1 hypothetical protein DQX04_00125 [Aliidiomarina sp. B3213]TCZ93373.1 hypothetical protein EYQ95_05175 [Lysobacter sp. N42]
MITSLQGYKVYIAPANPKGKLLAESLEQKRANVIGLVDNLKTGEGIINLPEQAEHYDYLVIADGPYQQEIARTLVQKGFQSQSILCEQEGHFEVYNYGFVACVSHKIQQLSIKALKTFVSLVSSAMPSQRVVYYTEDFVDNNTLSAWFYHAKEQPKTLLVGKNLSDTNLPYLDVKTFSGAWALMRAKCVVLDHEYQGTLFNIIREKRPCIQLYHGLPYKFLAGNRHFEHINDFAFVSSSEYFNQHIFPQLFNAQAYLTIGYPRNDVFLQAANDRCWLNTPESQPQHIIESTGKIWVYMPTYRDDGTFNMPFSLSKMQALCEQLNRSLILKFHPFVAEQVIQEFGLQNAECNIVSLPHYPNIYLYPTRMNIYPWLADTEVLITDYSSVAFDFLLADKPMVFFQYDHHQYYQNRGKFTFPTDEFAAGHEVYKERELFEALTQITEQNADTYKDKRQKLLRKLGLNKELASPELVKFIQEKL